MIGTAKNAKKGGEKMKQLWTKPQIIEIKINMTENGGIPKVGSCEDGWTKAGLGTGVVHPQ